MRLLTDYSIGIIFNGFLEIQMDEERRTNWKSQNCTQFCLPVLVVWEGVKMKEEGCGEMLSYLSVW